ncbi:putative membrane protein [plant metagenome]|uniref:Putative membrane protein n=1 Tax=plant metagenome TaxID=1297885 RepID=A0A484QL20_9ZZZZ
MSLIVAARFETFDAAQAAAGKLFAQGWAEDAINIFFVNPPGAHDRYPVGGDRAVDPDAKGAQKGAWSGAALCGAVGAAIGAGLLALVGGAGWGLVVGGALGAYLGAFAGALLLAGRGKAAFPSLAGETSPAKVRPAGVLLAVHVEAGQQQDVAQRLRELGGTDVERAQGRWREGRWVDFDPVEAPQPVTPGDAPPNAGAPMR